MIRRLTGVLVLALGAAATPSISKAQESDPAKALDAKIHAAIYRAIDTGYRLFNANDQAGCYRVYQGALTALVPILDGRPELKEAAEKALADAERQGDYSSRAFTLRKGLDVVYAATAGAKPEPRSLWTRLGGEPAVKAVIHEFVGVAAADPKVDFTRGGKYKLDAEGVANLEKLLVELVSATTGGPLKYEGRDMKAAHEGMRITDAEFNALAADLIGVLDKFNVPKKEKDELIAIVASTKPAIVEAARSDVPPPDPMPDEPKPDKPAPDAPKPVTDTPKPDKPAGKPLWDRLGGEVAVKAVIHDFVAKAAADPKVDFTRGGQYKLDDAGVEKLEKLLVELVSATTGGPLKYEGRDMKESHKGMKITDAQFGALAADLIEVLKEYKVPQKEIDELVAIVASTKKDIVEDK